MRLLVTSDWQCHAGNLDRCHATLHRLIEVALDVKATHILHLGDVKDALNPVDQKVTNFLVHASQVIALNKKVPFLVLLGNHDRTTLSDESDHCFPAMEAAGARCFDRPSLVDLGQGVGIYLVPWFRDRQELLKAFASRPKTVNETLILGFHADVNAARYSLVSGRQAEGGLTSKDIHRRDYALCLSGHVHMPQDVNGVTYVGSPFSQDWGEVNQEKRFLLVTCNGPGPLVMESIPTGLPGLWDPKLPGFPKDRTWQAEDQIRIRTHADIKDLQGVKEKAERQYPGAKIQVTQVVEAEAVNDPRLDPSASDDDLIDRYLRANPVTEPGRTKAYLRYHLPHGGMFGLPRLVFQRAVAKNMLCFKHCELDMHRPGVTLVTGVNQDWGDRSNGSGKTSLMATPLIAMDGESPKGQRHDSWRRCGAKGPSLAEQYLELADGSKLHVRRSRKPPGLQVFRDGKDITQASVQATQTWLERTTGLTWDVMVNALYIGQREVGTLLTGTDKQRKELLSQFLGLERFQKVEEAIRRDLNGWKQFAATVEAEASVTADAVDRQKKYIAEQVVAHVKPDLKAQKQAEKRVAALEAEIQTLDAKLAEQRKQRDRHIHRAGIWAQRVARYDERFRRARTQLQKLKALSGVCPVCRGPIREGDKRRHAHEIRQEMLTASARLDRCHVKEERYRSLARRAEKVSYREQALLNGLRLEREEQLEKVFDIQQQVEKEKALQTALQAQERELVQLQHRYQIQTRCLEAIDVEMQFLASCLGVVHRDGLPSFLCAAVAPKLNALAAEYAEAFGEGEIQVRFEVQGGDLDVQIRNAHGGKDVSDQSHGELRLAGLIASFALREALAPYNVLMLDEPGDGLDAKNARTFAAALQTVAERFGTLLVTTHNPNILAPLEPDHHLEVVKSQGVATVKVLR